MSLSVSQDVLGNWDNFLQVQSDPGNNSGARQKR